MPKKPPMLEKKLEEKLRLYAKSRGCKWIKFTSPANPSVPDRILMGPVGGKGKLMFIELKREGEVPTDAQANTILDYCGRGLDARWTDNLIEGKAWIDEVCS